MKTWQEALFSLAMGLLLSALLVTALGYGAAIPLPELFPQSQFSFYLVTAISYLVSVSILTIIAMSTYGIGTAIFKQRPRLCLTALLTPMLMYSVWAIIEFGITMIMMQVALFALVMVLLKKLHVTV